MTLLQDLLPASFGGIKFLVRNTSTTGGRKTATHEFVNSDNRNVEDLGKLLRTYNVTGTITGAGYFQERDALIRALETKGQQTLIHPFYGRVQVVAKPFTLTEDLTGLGAAEFSMVFEAANDRVVPQPFPSSEAAVDTASNTLNTQLQNDVADSFLVGSRAKKAFSEAQVLLEGITESFESVTELFAPDIQAVTEFTAAISQFSASAVNLIFAPSQLALSIKNLFDQVNLIITVAPEQGLAALERFFDSNSDSENLTASTDVGNAISAEAAQIIVNEQTLTRQMRINSLSLAYQVTAGIEFSNLNDLDTQQQKLEGQYRTVVSDTEIPSATRELLNLLRDQVEVFFQNERLTINRVFSISVKRMPAQVFTYLLYGELTLYQDIVKLNSDADVSHYEGLLETLTQ